MESFSPLSENQRCLTTIYLIRFHNYYKTLSDEKQAQLISYLQKKYFPNISNNEIYAMSQDCTNLAQIILSDIGERAVNVFGSEKNKKGFKFFSK